MSRNPTMPEIRQAIEQARALDGLEDTEDFALRAPGLLAQLVRILDLYVGHEPTLAEEAAYVREQQRAEVLTKAADFISASGTGFPVAVRNGVGWAVRTLRRMAARRYLANLHRDGHLEMRTDSKGRRYYTFRNLTCGRCGNADGPFRGTSADILCLRCINAGGAW